MTGSLANVAEQRQVEELISSYVERRLASKSDDLGTTHFTIPQVRGWLTWLAQHQNRSPLLIELLQPDMLAEPDRRNFRLLAAGLLAIALTACATFSVALGNGVEWGFRRGAAAGVEVGLTTAAVVGAVGFVLLWPTFLLGRRRWFGLGLAVVFSIVRGIAVGGGCPDGTLDIGWWAGTRAALFTLMVCVVPFMLYAEFIENRISLVQPLSNWNFTLRSGRLGVVIGVAIGVLFWIFFGPARGITFGTVCILVLTAIFCMQRSGFDVPPQPNHGIVQSRNNALVFGLSALLFITPVVTLSYSYEFGWQTGLENGVQSLSVVLVALIFGGIPVIQHWSLRWLCAAKGYLPLKIVQFLDEMTRMMLVQRVGGAYRFSHDLIGAFFARSGRAPTPDARQV